MTHRVSFILVLPNPLHERNGGVTFLLIFLFALAVNNYLIEQATFRCYVDYNRLGGISHSHLTGFITHHLHFQH